MWLDTYQSLTSSEATPMKQHLWSNTEVSPAQLIDIIKSAKSFEKRFHSSILEHVQSSQL